MVSAVSGGSASRCCELSWENVVEEIQAAGGEALGLKIFMKVPFKSELLGCCKNQVALPIQDLKQCVHTKGTWALTHKDTHVCKPSNTFTCTHEHVCAYLTHRMLLYVIRAHKHEYIHQHAWTFVLVHTRHTSVSASFP